MLRFEMSYAQTSLTWDRGSSLQLGFLIYCGQIK